RRLFRSASEWTTTGRATTAYALNEGLALSRARLRYDDLLALPGGTCDRCKQELRARAQIHLAPAGHVIDVDDDESVSATPAGGKGARVTVRDAFNLTLRAVGAFEAPSAVDLDPGAFEVHRPGVVSAMGDARRSLLDQRVAGLTYDAMTNGILVAGIRGAP